MRDHLNGRPEVVAPSFFLQHGFVDFAGCEVIQTAQFTGGEALVVTEIEIGLSTVVEDIDFTVLERTHRAGVYV